ncbi:BlaI/MecI/CopY family transcriptional regulator [Streptococcus gordonii]|jgi:penicillinase repressor, putative|uniref:Penicillinase repressor, putative n=1 Tax=Streptococcus gordonii (strain Challis / ATCC 35105 / BCRC 15272 / CH1 / DL1 / V288) TaxID=467705 RepID=A8AXQ3_STRGC|nr:BlaI/MecI/CopY family transcriptional regulator [Streptococcus gordonii]ABV09642.1 penicillinase repressor, putative [Streptococcus gordonii str. Challis substr. CH1]MBZ2122987.1 BlaI/MecI/CopY family transcriptional regulator [Streptococcus gordonii]MBZ2137306.1 BlaI/MecI/CopY family transcriptional regulator [Streptococcus gordonii]MCY7137585.1 BlaI/MecI/CopY family transcriptional regulator [Streptococcus gordonii]MCY7138749.1 BlaI/MecI/CopY family transcriptional regulator [Streptococcu
MKTSIKRLPDGEFTILKIIWQLPNPTTSAQIMEKLGEDNHWKPQTLLTVLARLTEKGFLESVRKGRERQYTAIISEDEYLEVETSDFLKRYSGHSMGGLVKTLFSSNSLSDNELDELRSLLDQNK